MGDKNIMSAFEGLGKTGELACTFATLVLHDDSANVSAENINKLLKASNVECEPYWATLFANALADVNIGDVLFSSGGGGVSAPAPTGGDANAPAKAEAVKEEEKAEEEEEDMDLGDLF